MWHVKFSFAKIGINYILKCITIEKLFYILRIFHNITVFVIG